MTLVIRDATAADEAAFRQLWGQYLVFYRATLLPRVTDATWARLIDPGSPVKARLAVVDGQVQGFATYLHHPSTWVLSDDCYLEDLFVRDTARGQGLGRALIDDLAALAAQRGWSRLYWNTDQGNTRARALYDRYAPADGHIRYRITV